MRFIKIKGIYYDYEIYRKIVLLLENALRAEAETAAARYGFKRRGNGFYNETLDLQLEISFKTLSRLEFI